MLHLFGVTDIQLSFLQHIVSIYLKNILSDQLETWGWVRLLNVPCLVSYKRTGLWGEHNIHTKLQLSHGLIYASRIIVSYKQTESGLTWSIGNEIAYFASKNPIIYVFLNNIRDSLVARITVCRMVDRGSIPRRGEYFFFQWSRILFGVGLMDRHLFYPILLM